MSLEADFQLGPWKVRPTLGTLTGPDGTVHLEPKVMGVLVYLAERAGEVVTREQFIERVWNGRVVSDEALSRCISLLRTELGDSSREPRYIQTLPKIGYRLITPLANGGEPIPTVAAVPRARRGRGIRALIHAGMVLFVAALAWAVLRISDAPPADGAAERAAIVVLPFANVSGDPNNQYFSDGLTEELIDRLARVTGLQVVARTSAFSLKNSHEDVRAIGERLGVGYVLEGSVRKEGDRIRITAQLVDADRGFHIWSERFDSTLPDIFTVQDDIANAIVTQLQPRLAADRSADVISTAPPTKVIAAYELLLRGRHQLEQRDETPIRRSIDLFRQALALDPGFIDANCELARAYALLPYYSYEDQEEMFDLAVATIDRGAAVNPLLRAAAQDTLAFIHFGRWQWIEAAEGFRRALAERPEDPNLRQWYSQFLASVGDTGGSLQHAQLARKLDILSPVVNDRLAVAYLWTNDDERARNQFATANELGTGPGANREAYLVLLLRQGDYARAREILMGLQKLFARADEWVDPFLAALKDPTLRPAAIAAVERATQEHAISPKYQFGAWLYLGQTGRAMDVAFQLLEEPAAFDVEFLFARETAALRAHPRFGELITALNLDRYWDRFGWPSWCARQGKDDGKGIKCR